MGHTILYNATVVVVVVPKKPRGCNLHFFCRNSLFPQSKPARCVRACTKSNGVLAIYDVGRTNGNEYHHMNPSISLHACIKHLLEHYPYLVRI